MRRTAGVLPRPAKPAAAYLDVDSSRRESQFYGRGYGNRMRVTMMAARALISMTAASAGP
jgi:hypothetical protein